MLPRAVVLDVSPLPLTKTTSVLACENDESAQADLESLSLPDPHSHSLLSHLITQLFRPLPSFTAAYYHCAREAE